jgi:hypothetical protein
MHADMHMTCTPFSFISLLPMCAGQRRVDREDSHRLGQGTILLGGPTTNGPKEGKEGKGRVGIEEQTKIIKLKLKLKLK